MGSGSCLSVIFILEKEKQLEEAKGIGWMRPMTDGIPNARVLGRL